MTENLVEEPIGTITIEISDLTLERNIHVRALDILSRTERDSHDEYVNISLRGKGTLQLDRLRLSDRDTVSDTVEIAIHPQPDQSQRFDEEEGKPVREWTASFCYHDVFFVETVIPRVEFERLADDYLAGHLGSMTLQATTGLKIHERDRHNGYLDFPERTDRYVEASDREGSYKMGFGRVSDLRWNRVPVAAPIPSSKVAEEMDGGTGPSLVRSRSFEVAVVGLLIVIAVLQL